MQLLPLAGFLLLSLSTAACADNALFITDAQAVRLADGRVATTVTATCDGDCSAEASHCVRVAWQTASGGLDGGADDAGAADGGAPSGTLDDSTACATTAPSSGATASLVVTSKVPIPHDSSITGLIELVDASGHLLPNSTSAEGAAEDTQQTIADP